LEKITALDRRGKGRGGKDNGSLLHLFVLKLRQVCVRVQLRKTERRNEDLKADCEELEEQVSQLSAELRQAHDDLRRLGAVDDELATAKQISIKLHDECERLTAQCQLYRQQLDLQRGDGAVSSEASLPVYSV